jgi:hypothetical protein
MAMAPQTVWIVGTWLDGSWEFQGVYSCEQRAAGACLHPNWFIGPARVDESVPERTEEWPGCYYPRARG